MAAFEDPRLEKLAQGLASDLNLHVATRKAGYSRQCVMSRKRAARQDVVARVAEIQQERREAAADVRPVIKELMSLARKAGGLGTAAGMVAARGLLAEAAQVRARLAPPAPLYADPATLHPMYTKAEWLAEFAPNGGRPLDE